MDNRIVSVYCPQCGAPARFDIVKQQYLCDHCGGKVTVDEVLEQKKGFRRIQSKKISESLKDFRLFHFTCNGCGADLVMEEKEALSTCPFCGKSLVRKDYLHTEDMPEAVIPFRITLKEAKQKLQQWCDVNRRKPEAKLLSEHIDELNAYYLPYELIRGPVSLHAERMDGFRTYFCRAFLEDDLVNRSVQFDNLLLDGMEPYDIDDLTEFDFGYVAGHRVKIADLNDTQLQERAEKEVSILYASAISKTLETDRIDVTSDLHQAVSLPVLLPVYYLKNDSLMAAVNGQSGKVAIRSLKETKYYFLPWWFKAILATLAFSGIAYLSFCLAGMNPQGSLFLSAMLAFFFLIVTLCLYSDTVKNRFIVSAGYRIYSSDPKQKKRTIEDPVFFETVKNESRPVVLKFSTPSRILRMVLLCFVALFLPVIVAWFLTGFDFGRLDLSGSAAWFCVAVPVVPIYLLKFGIVELHDNPWIYLNENGKLKRYRAKRPSFLNRETLKAILKALFVPPVSLAVWFGILSFIVMVYLTAGGQ